MSSLTVIARWRFAPGRRAALAPLVDELVDRSRAEPGCRSYRVFVDESDPDVLVLVEEYLDAAAVDAHRASEHFQRLVLGQIVPGLVSREVQRVVPLR
ncbi:MAG: putative quinol monooxygenase [Myxococcaceae bacterium]|nr:putative quinol monooxygenase [Myxococcaceae bacterium]